MTEEPSPASSNQHERGAEVKRQFEEKYPGLAELTEGKGRSKDEEYEAHFNSALNTIKSRLLGGQKKQENEKQEKSE